MNAGSRSTCALIAALVFLALPAHAAAFCGFYVSGADAKMFNNATTVVLMRDGTTTVLSMKNNYEGPPKDFAMVVPVPVVLQKDNVKVLSNAVFDKVDALAAPRLVEYWEQDPCGSLYDDLDGATIGRGGGGMVRRSATKKAKEFGVKIEAQFEVGEYEVVILSAKESNGLEGYLKSEKYNIPDGAAPVLKPYIEGGQYFFVAKVNPKKVTFKDGQASLSPLRFHYDSKDFQLPVRLGLLNAKGKQDLLVHILAKNKRFETANYTNVTIPTNIVVDKKVKAQFANFYVSLFDRVLEEHPGSVVTEYAWQANNCDPCPTGAVGGGALTNADLLTLGADVLGGAPPTAKGRGSWSPSAFSGWVLTRLHARYSKDELKEDLVFREAKAIVGGRGTPKGEQGEVGEQGAKASGFNQFQGRYIMLNPWEGEIACQSPQRGRWGGPPSGSQQVMPAQNTAFAQRGAVKLAQVVRGGKVPGLTLAKAPAVESKVDDSKAAEATTTGAAPPKAATTTSSAPETKKGCAHAGHRPVPGGALGAVAMLAGLVMWRRRTTWAA